MKRYTPEMFSIGDSVGCYFGVVVTFGEVEAITAKTITVRIEFNRYEDGDINRRTTEVESIEYLLRGKDGLYVRDTSFDQYVPEAMIAGMHDLGECNRWRYSPGVVERLKRAAMGSARRGYVYVQEKSQKKVQAHDQ